MIAFNLAKIEPSNESIPSDKRLRRNQGETDPIVGEIRMRRLMPYALQRLGRDALFGPERGRLSLRRDMADLCRSLHCGAEKILEWISLICNSGPENVRSTDFLKRAQGGGTGKSKIRRDLRDRMFEAIHEVCSKQGYEPGTAAASKRVRAEMLRLGGIDSRLPSPRALRSALLSRGILNDHVAATQGDHMCRVLDENVSEIALNGVVLMDGTTFTNESDPSECLYALDDMGRVLGLVNANFGEEAATRGIWTVLPHVGAPNTFLTNLSIHRGIVDKAPLLKRYGIRGDWPWCGKPRRLVTDRGLEYIGNQAKRTMSELGIGFVDRSPPKTPHFRGTGERFNRTAHTLFVDFLRSDVVKGYLRRVPGKPGAAGIAFKDLDRAMIEWVVNHYHNRPHKGIGGASPLDRFHDLVLGKRGFPISGLPIPVSDRPDLLWDFLWEVHRRINHVGISIDNRLYRSSELSQFLSPGRRSSGARCAIRFNPYSLGNVFVRSVAGGRIITVPFVYKNDVHPVSDLEREQLVDTSIWEWNVAYADLQRVGKKPTEREIVNVLGKRKDYLVNSPSKISPRLTKRDVANSAMQSVFGKVGVPETATQKKNSSGEQRRLKPIGEAKILPVGSGGASEY